ncbi:putative bifunctional diguanylate cyclase/phosphodiesterase [Mycobacterium sp. MMS18-G62]
MPKFSLAMGLATTAAVAWSAWLVGGWGGQWTVQTADSVGMVAVTVFSAVCAGLAARSESGRRRRAWIWLTVGLAGYAVGAAISASYHVFAGMEHRPFPSAADVPFLVFKITACVALVLFPGGFSGHSRIRILFDGLIVAIALFEVAWVAVLHDVYESQAGGRSALWVSVAYLVTGICIITVALLVLARARTDQRATLILLTAGIIVNALTGGAFVYLTAHSLFDRGVFVDIGRAAALLAFGIAALISRGAAPTGVQTRTVPAQVSVWLPYLPVVLATAACTSAILRRPGFAPIIVSSVLLISVVLARQFIAVSENRRLLAMTADQALRDPLTGLANRALFRDRLTHAMQLHQRDKQSVAVLSMDLDDFKLVNDSLGHPAGDSLLVQAAERILGCVRTGDTVARLGGDEFAVLMEGPADHSRRVAQRVVQAFDEPFFIDGHDILVRPSIGLAVVPSDDRDVSADGLMKQADVAMYSAKRSRASGVHSFSPDMYLVDPNEIDVARRTYGNGAATAVRLLGQLRHAIDNGGLSLVYQPKFDLRDERIVGVEALVRWPHPERGLLSPDHFLPLVREHGLMRSVTEFVLARAVDDAAQWNSRAVGVPIAVNVFAPSLGDLDLPKQILSALGRRNLSTDALTLEMTEDVLADNMDRTRRVLERLRHHGIRVAIDDFGSGYSALSYLHDLPIDEVKLDRQFIAPVLVDWRAAAIVHAVIDLAHVLGVMTVAEGVEDAVTIARLREYGCDVAQGYYYSPPITADEMFEMLSSATRAPAAARLS